MEFALSLAVSLFAFAGLGAWWRGPSRAVPVLVGAVTVPALLLTLDLVFHVPLAAAAKAVLAAGAVGLLARSRRLDRTLAVHPVVLLPLAVAAAAVLRGGVDYLPYSWDEFSAWVTWPREAFLADSFAAPGSHWFDLGYTQGLPALTVFPQLLAHRFDPVLLLGPLVLLHAGLMGLAFEVVGDRLRAAGWTPVQAGLAGWAVVLALLGAEAAWTLVPQLVLVEKPQIHLFAAIVLLLVQAERHRGLAREFWVAAGLLAAGAYLVKATSLALVPALAAAALMAGGRHGRRSGLRAAAFLLVPVAVAWLGWRLAAPASAAAGCAGNPLAALDGAAAVAGHLAATAARVAQGAANYAAGFKLPLTLAALAAAALSFRDRTIRPAWVVLGLWGGMHLVGLVGTYGLCFGSYESSQLASLPRYLRLLLRVLQTAGLLLLAEAALVWLGARRPRPAVLAAAVALLAVVQARALERSLTNVSTRAHEPQATAELVAKVFREGEALASRLAAKGLAGGTVLQIVQGGQGFETVIGRQAGFGVVPGERWRFRVLPTFSFGPAAADPWTVAVSPDEMRARLLAADAIWPIAVDDWMRDVLAPLVSPGPCADRPEDHFLLRRADGTGFVCAVKE